MRKAQLSFEVTYDRYKVDVVSKELGKTFPATADKVFLPEQKRVQTLNEWISVPYVHSRTHAYPSSDHA